MLVPGSCCSFSFLALLSLSRHVRPLPGRRVGDVSADLQRRVHPASLLRLVNCVSEASGHGESPIRLLPPLSPAARGGQLCRQLSRMPGAFVMWLRRSSRQGME